MFSKKSNVYKYLLPNLFETQRICFCWFLEFGFLQELENFSAIRDCLDELELNLSVKSYKIKQPKLVFCSLGLEVPKSQDVRQHGEEKTKTKRKG